MYKRQVRQAAATPLVDVQKTVLWLASSTTLSGWHGEYVDRALPEFCIVAETLGTRLGEPPIVKDTSTVGNDAVQPRRRLWSQIIKALQVAYRDGCLYGYVVAVAWVLTGKGVRYFARKVGTRSVQTWSASYQDSPDVAILRELAASALDFERALHTFNRSAVAAGKTSSLPTNTGPPQSEKSRLLQQHAADIVSQDALDLESAFEMETVRGFTPQFCSVRILGRGDHAEQGFAVAVLGNELITQRAAAIARRNQANPSKSRCGWVDE